MKKLLSLLFYFCIIICSAQKKGTADTLAKYSDQKMLQKADDATRFGKNTERDIYYNNLFNRNIPDSLRSEAYYTIAFNYHDYTDFGPDYSIEMLKKALKIEKKNKNYRNQILCYDGLGLFYGIKNDEEKVLDVLHKMKEVLETKVTPRAEYLKLQSIPYRTYGLIGDFKRAQKGYRKANKDIESYLSDNTDFHGEDFKIFHYEMKYNYIHLIASFNYLKELDSSAYYIKKVKKLEKEGYVKSAGMWHEETMFLVLSGKYDQAIAQVEASKKYIMNSKTERCQALHALALCYQYKKDYKKVLDLCEEALKIKIRPFSFLNYELEFLKMASNSAQKLGDLEKANLYSKKYIEVSQSLDYHKKADFIAKLYDQEIINPLGDKLQTEKRFSNYYLFGAISLLAVSCYLAWRIIKSRKDKNKFLEIIAQLEQKEALKKEKEILADIPCIEEIPNYSDVKMSNSIPKTLNEDIERKILKQLAYFERKQQFISQNITSGSLAADFNTNVVYLSAVLKKYKNNNFNNYINELRIDYIISKLKSNPEYSTYKIAYLAEECGFSSHTTFIRIFTQHKGIPPSKFISLLSQYH